MSEHDQTSEENGMPVPPVLEDGAESRDTQDEEFLESCRQRLCPSCDVAAGAEEVRLRALAEMENFKKRLQREKDEQARYATESVLGDLLPTLDNLDLALQYGSRSEACKDMLTGVEMTHKLLLEAVRRHGLEPVGEPGEEFNPALHEAIGQEESPEHEAGRVLRVMQKGYTLKERLLRPAKVIVSARPSKHFSAEA